MDTYNLHFSIFDPAHDPAYERVDSASTGNLTSGVEQSLEPEEKNRSLMPDVPPPRSDNPLTAQLRRICIEQSQDAIDRAFQVSRATWRFGKPLF